MSPIVTVDYCISLFFLFQLEVVAEHQSKYILSHSHCQRRSDSLSTSHPGLQQLYTAT